MNHYDELTGKDKPKKPKVFRHGISIKNFWGTPWDVYTALDDEFDFDLDAAAEASSAKCVNWLGLDHPDPARRDALMMAGPWPGTKPFLNPPYSPDGGELMRWVQRAHREVAHCRHAVLLLPGIADTAWAEFLWLMGAEIRFTPRISFIDPEGGRTAPMGGNMVAVLRPNQVERQYGRRNAGEELISFGYAPWKEKR